MAAPNITNLGHILGLGIKPFLGNSAQPIPVRGEIRNCGLQPLSSGTFSTLVRASWGFLISPSWSWACSTDWGPQHRAHLPPLPSGARWLAQPLTSEATAAIKLISFLIYTRLSLGELWADLIKVSEWCAYAISFTPLMPSCQNKTLKKGFEGVTWA